MEILFVDPPFYRWALSAPFGVSNYGFICVATYLNTHGHKAEILDMNIKGLSLNQLSSILREKNPDVVGVPSAMNCYVPDSLNVARISKAVNPNTVTVGGGINMSLNSENIMKSCPELDFIVRGDGEVTALELVNALENGEKDFSKIQGITWQKDGEIILNPDRPPIADLDSLPIPDWDLVEPDKYGINTFPPSWGPQVLLTLSRGCPYNCEFCAPTKAAYNMYRTHSPERCLEIITILKEKYGRKMFWLNDLIQGVKEKEFTQILEGIIERKLDINMCIDMRVDLVLNRLHLLPLMRKAGIRIVTMGFETPLEDDIEKYNKYPKGFNVYDGAIEAVRALRRNKINSWGFFMHGAPHHTPEHLRKIYKFSDKVDADLTVYAFVTPHPGTPYYDKVKDFIKTDDLAFYDETGPVTNNPYMTEDQMRIMVSELFVHFYSKPSRIFRRLVLGTSGGYGKWWYKFVTSNWFDWGPAAQYTWKRCGWAGFKTDKRKLENWAKKVLGTGLFERAWQRLIFDILPTPFKMAERQKVEEKVTRPYWDVTAQVFAEDGLYVNPSDPKDEIEKKEQG